MADATVATVIAELLEPLLGRFTTSKALELVSQRCGKSADELGTDDLPTVIEALQPMLRTLLGASSANNVIEDLKERLGAGG